MAIWNISILRTDGDMYARVQIQNEYTGNVHSKFSKIFKDKNGFYCHADSNKHYLNNQVSAFLSYENEQKKAIEFYRKYKDKIY